MVADVESARREWEVAYRRLEEETRDPVRADALFRQLEVVGAELRRRVGSIFTLTELASEYQRADAWVRGAVAERAPAPGWPRTLTLVQGAAFFVYARGAQDYSP